MSPPTGEPHHPPIGADPKPRSFGGHGEVTNVVRTADTPPDLVSATGDQYRYLAT